MKKKEILVVEDDRVLNQLAAFHLKEQGYRVSSVYHWAEAARHLEDHEPDLILMDARLPDGDSIPRLPQLVDLYPVIILTAYGTVRDAVEAIKAGAADYLLKPVSAEELLLTVERVLENAALKSDHQFCVQRLRSREGSSAMMVGDSPPIEEVRQLIQGVAPTEMTVLIHGESGTGKELVARAIHDASERAERNFVAVDCCTLQEGLFESELFGHEKGAFSGADRLKKGLIEGAEGGTLFLDEIGEIEPGIQAKLLRVLETGQFRRQGGTKDLTANVRVVAATNGDLEAMSRAGSFRADLFYRLNAFSIRVPPLRERREDIPAIAGHFILNHNFSRRINKALTSAALRKLTAYDWPGNIRELKNVVERAIILSRDTHRIRPEHLAFGPLRNGGGPNIQLQFDHEPTLEEIEGHYLKLQLDRHAGHRAKVAEVMGVSERNIYRMIKRHGLLDR